MITSRGYRPLSYTVPHYERERERRGRGDIEAEDGSRKQDRRFNLLVLGTYKALLTVYN
jgi:hypothetical protein